MKGEFDSKGNGREKQANLAPSRGGDQKGTESRRKALLHEWGGGKVLRRKGKGRSFVLNCQEKPDMGKRTTRPKRASYYL